MFRNEAMKINVAHRDTLHVRRFNATSTLILKKCAQNSQPNTNGRMLKQYQPMETNEATALALTIF